MKSKILIALCAIVSFASAEMIKVTESTAITKPFTQKVKVGETCYEDTVERYVDCGDHDENTIGLDTLLGATIGVVIGNQMGGGNGRDAARIIGGLGGGYIANQTRESKKCKTYNQVTRCEPQYEYVTEDKVIGYRNCAYYNGQKVCKESSTPLDYLEVTQKIYVH